MQLHRLIALALVALCFIAAIFGIQRRQAQDMFDLEQALRGNEPRLELIGLDGVITGSRTSSNSAMAVRNRLLELREEDDVKGVLLAINSPGGTVGASKEVYDAVIQLRERKPVVASMLDQATSGGYYIASAATRIYANAGTLTGSIGVILNGINVRGLMDKVGVEPQTIKTGAFKDILSPYRPLAEPERKLLEELLQDTYQGFVRDVADGRNTEVEKIRKLADGRIYTGRQAKELGLIDTVGTYDDALEELRKLVREKFNLPQNQALPIKRSPGSFDRLLDDILGSSSLANIGGLGMGDLKVGLLEKLLQKAFPTVLPRDSGSTDLAPPLLLMPSWY